MIKVCTEQVVDNIHVWKGYIDTPVSLDLLPGEEWIGYLPDVDYTEQGKKRKFVKDNRDRLEIELSRHSIEWVDPQVCYSDILESLYTKPGEPGEEVGVYSDYLEGSLGTIVLGEMTEERWLQKHFENTVVFELEYAGYEVVGQINTQPWDELFYMDDQIGKSLDREVKIRRVYASNGLYTRNIWIFLWDSTVNRWLTSRQLIQSVDICLEYSTPEEVSEFYGSESEVCPCNQCRMNRDLIEWISGVFHNITWQYIVWDETDEIKPY